MEPQLSCIPCIIKQIIYSARAVSGDPWLQNKIVTNVLQVLSEMEYSLLPVTLVNRIFNEAVDKLGVSDPFQEQKKVIFSSFTDILAKIRKHAPEVDQDRLAAALKMSASANHYPSFIDLDETFDAIIETAQKSFLVFEEEKFLKEYKKTNKAVLLASGFVELPLGLISSAIGGIS